ncbi:MAG TPA: tetratricopeptide repeat protein [Syntrophales bacterium]|nr:tetratricopeptide repeat protein [Syntrophales bacterium]
MRKQFIYKIVVFSLLFFLNSISSYARNMNILVQPFQNTGDAQLSWISADRTHTDISNLKMVKTIEDVPFSWISTGMTDTIVVDLNNIRNINVILDKDRKQVLGELRFTHSRLVDETTIVKIGKLTGADIIFTGSFLVSGNSIRVISKLINVETGKVESSTKLDGTLATIFDLQDKVLFSLMGEAEKIKIADINPVKLTAKDKKTIEGKYRPKTEAYEWYSRGLQTIDKDPNLALDYFDRAVKIDQNYTDPLIQAGFVAGYTLNLFDEAHDYFKNANIIFKSRGDTSSFDYSNLMVNIGLVYFSKGEIDKALRYYENSQAIRDRLSLQNTAHYSLLMTNIGAVHQYKGQFDSALKYFQHSQVIHASLGLYNTEGYATIVMSMGNVYFNKGEIDKALRYYEDSQAIKDRIGLQDTVGWGYLLYYRARVYEKQGQRYAAGRYFRMAYDSFTRADYSGHWRDLALKNAERLGY